LAQNFDQNSYSWPKLWADPVSFTFCSVAALMHSWAPKRAFHLLLVSRTIEVHGGARLGDGYLALLARAGRRREGEEPRQHPGSGGRCSPRAVQRLDDGWVEVVAG
jgi:hypothetical protein